MNEIEVKDIKYNDDKFVFIYRVSALIFNKDKTKILLFFGNHFSLIFHQICRQLSFHTVFPEPDHEAPCCQA